MRWRFNEAVSPRTADKTHSRRHTSFNEAAVDRAVLPWRYDAVP